MIPHAAKSQLWEPSLNCLCSLPMTVRSLLMTVLPATVLTAAIVINPETCVGRSKKVFVFSLFFYLFHVWGGAAANNAISDRKQNKRSAIAIKQAANVFFICFIYCFFFVVANNAISDRIQNERSAIAIKQEPNIGRSKKYFVYVFFV